MEKNKIFLEQDPQFMLNIIEALTFYRDNAVMPKYRDIITKQINQIYDQMALQKLELFINDKIVKRWSFGDRVRVNNHNAIIIGCSDVENCIKCVIVENEDFRFIDFPISEIEFIVEKNNLN